MLRVDYLINKMIENINKATIELEDVSLETTEDLFKKE